MKDDVEALFEILYASSHRKSGTIRHPGSIRLVLKDSGAFLGQSRDWQLRVLRNLADALRTPYDVGRFLCLEVGPVEGKLLCVASSEHDEMFQALLKLYDNCNDEGVMDAILLVLGSVISAGTTVKNLKHLFNRAAQGLISKDSKSQLRMLRTIDCGLQRSKNFNQDEWESDDGIAITVALAIDPTNREPYLPGTGDEERSKVREIETASPSPQHYFGFGGPAAGIDISGIEKWPFPREYCVWYWARLDEFCGRCSILKVQSEEGHGINISLVGDDVIGYSILIESRDDSKSGSVRVAIPPDRMSSRCWHQVTIYHYARMIGSSVVKVFVDGFEIKQANGYGFLVMYPTRMSQAMSKVRVFEDFDGQAGPIYLFSEGVTPAMSTALLCSHLSQEGDDHVAIPGVGLTASAVERGFESKVFLCYDPRVFIKDICIDLYGGRDGALSKTNSYIWGLESIKNTVFAIGGIPALLPFLWKKPGRAKGEVSDLFCEGACIIQILYLLARLQTHHLPNQRDFRKIGGPALVASALERIPVRVLTSAASKQLYIVYEEDSEDEGMPSMVDEKAPMPDAPLFTSLRNLFYAVDTWPETMAKAGEKPVAHITGAAGAGASMNVSALGTNVSNRRRRQRRCSNEELYNALESAIDCHLLFNIKLIARCTNEDGSPSWTQLQWFDHLHARVSTAPAFYRSFIGLEQWFDHLRLFYVKDVSENTAIDIHRREFLDFISFHTVRIAVAMLADEVSDDDLHVLLCCAVGAGHGTIPSSPLDNNSSSSPKNSPLGPLSFFSMRKKNEEILSPRRNADQKWSAVDIELCRDAIRVFIILLRMEYPPKGFFEKCAKLDSGNGLASLLSVNVLPLPQMGESVRALALRCINAYILRVDSQVSNFDSIAASSGASSASVRSATAMARMPKGVHAFADVGGFASILHELSRIAASTPPEQLDLNSTYTVLLEMMVSSPPTSYTRSGSLMRRRKSVASVGTAQSMGTATLTNCGTLAMTIATGDRPDEINVADVFAQDQSMFGPILDDTHHINNPHAVMVVLKLLPRMSLYLQQRVCQDLFLLLKFQARNRRAFAEIDGWESSLLQLLGSLSELGLQSSGSQVCFDMGIKLFVLVVQDIVCQSDDGWKELERVVSLRAITPGGDRIVRAVLVQLMPSILAFVKQEEFTFPTMWHNMQRLVLTVDMLIAVDPSNEDENTSIALHCVQIVDVLTSAPPEKLLQGDISPDEHGLIDMLRLFSWSIEPVKQDDLDKIRGPIAFGLVSLSLVALKHEETPRLVVAHAERLAKLVVYLRKMPRVRTPIRWSTQDGKKVKGEKSALAASTFVAAFDTVGRIRGLDDDGNMSAYSEALGSLLSLLKVICTHHEDLLLDLFDDTERIKKVVELQHDKEASWAFDPCLILPLFPESSEGETGFHFVGFVGAIQALTESRTGLKAFMESRLKQGWETYCAQEKNSPVAKLRGKRETMAIAYQQRLAYAELNRLSAFNTAIHERDYALVLCWRQLTVENAHDSSIWYVGRFEGKEEEFWMASGREDSMRRRILMCRNYHYDNHHSAAFHHKSEEIGDKVDQLNVSPAKPKNRRGTHRRNRTVAVGLAEVEELSHQLRKNEEDDMLRWWKWQGGRLKNDPDLTWYIWLGGKISTRRKKKPNLAVSTASPKHHHRQNTRSSDFGSPAKAAVESTDSLLNEVHDWAVSGWESTRHEQFVMQEGESIVRVFSNSQWISPLEVTRGRVEVSTSHLFFYATSTESTSGVPGLNDDEWENMSYGNDNNSPGGDGKNDTKNESPWKQLDKEMRRWKLADLTEIHGRRYLLRSTALELFFKDKTTIFLCFPTAKARSDCFNSILKQQTPNLSKTFKVSLKPQVVFEQSQLMEKWQNREISNFEYLMKLNTIAGRSYNDITQYPIFPWVLCDYTSETIDLDNPLVYRDLSKPIGALNEDRLNDFLERYETFNDSPMDIPPFHYGSHYSNAGIVLHYLLRQEPFTTLGIDLQGGRFDCPDRLFSSVLDCWLGSMESMSDVKELIPEFYYWPEMFLNSNKLKLGFQDNNTRIDDVVLPKWANGSVHEFIRIHREALESEYVSANLHNWIDLIFGYKQVGVEAEKAHNVFYYLTYEGAVDLDAIVDPVQRHSIETQIAHFGQTPSQLLDKPHPKREPLKNLKPFNVLNCTVSDRLAEVDGVRAFVPATSLLDIHPDAPSSSTGTETSRSSWGSLLKVKLPSMAPKALSSRNLNAAEIGSPLIYLKALGDRVICMHESLSVACHRFPVNGNISADTFKPGSYRVLNGFPVSVSPIARNSKDTLEAKSGSSLASIHSGCVASAKQGKLLLSGLYFDGSLRAQTIDSGWDDGAVVAHRGPILCVTICEKEEIVATGSEDCAVVVWYLGGAHDIREEMMDLLGAASGGDGNANMQVLNVKLKLTDHESPVTAVAVSSSLGVVVSGSSTGRVLVHSVHDGSFIRSISPRLKSGISNVEIGHVTGNILVYSKESRHMRIWTINGSLVAETETTYQAGAMCFSYVNDGREIVLTGEDNGVLHFRNSSNLESLTSLSLSSEEWDSVRSLAQTPGGGAIFAGTESGKLVVLQAVEL